jgi:hypothetical protein
MAQQVSALYVVDELEVETGFGKYLDTYHDTVL